MYFLIWINLLDEITLKSNTLAFSVSLYLSVCLIRESKNV